jgi:flagellar M-ring protein FliF
MGFSKDRGDSVNVVNAAFNEPEQVAPVELPFYKQPDNISMAKEIGRYTLFAALIAYLFFGVVRPMLRQAQERMAALPPPPQPLAELPAPAPGSAGDPLQRARALARDDPKVVANVVKGWVTRDE